MNLNKLAERIAASEGKRFGVSIAQIKELMGIFFFEVSRMTVEELTETINYYVEKRTKDLGMGESEERT